MTLAALELDYAVPTAGQLRARAAIADAERLTEVLRKKAAMEVELSALISRFDKNSPRSGEDVLRRFSVLVSRPVNQRVQRDNNLALPHFELFRQWKRHSGQFARMGDHFGPGTEVRVRLLGKLSQALRVQIAHSSQRRLSVERIRRQCENDPRLELKRLPGCP